VIEALENDTSVSLPASNLTIPGSKIAKMSTSTNAPSSVNSLPSPETARQIAEARAALEASMSNIGTSLDANLRSRAAKLKKLADEGQRKVKELGNVQNWAEMLERDFLVVEETLRLVMEGSEGDSEWETEGEDSDSDDGDGDEGGVEGDDKQASGEGKQRVVDGEGDTAMEGTEHVEKGKGKAVEVEQQVEIVGGSSTHTSGSDPSSSSVHTANSLAS
jgi:hypothetical protein